MKPLLPTLREKKRYIVFEIITESSLDSRTVKKEIVEKCTSFLGILDSAAAGIIMVEYNRVMGILKVNNKYLNKIKMALALIKTIDGRRVIVNCIKVSGILKKARAIRNQDG